MILCVMFPYLRFKKCILFPCKQTHTSYKPMGLYPDIGPVDFKREHILIKGKNDAIIF